jgi:hypothetical protein
MNEKIFCLATIHLFRFIETPRGGFLFSGIISGFQGSQNAISSYNGYPQ